MRVIKYSFLILFIFFMRLFVMAEQERREQPFNYKEIKAEAEKKFRPLGLGDFIVVQDIVSGREISGKYYGNESGKISIGGQVILLKNIDESKHYLFGESYAKKRRAEYIHRKFKESHRGGRLAKEDVASTDGKSGSDPSMEKEEDLSLSLPDAGNENKVLRELLSNKKEFPCFGIIRTPVRLSKRTLSKGELVKIRELGRHRLTCLSRDSLEFQTNPDNVYVLRETFNISNPFSLTQASMNMARKGRFSEALAYLSIAEKIDPGLKRVLALKETYSEIFSAQKAIRQGNSEIAKLTKDISKLTSRLAQNQQALRDDFAVKAGVRDSSPKYIEMIYKKRESKKKIQQLEKKKLSGLEDFCESRINKCAYDGDFISACVMCDIMTTCLKKLRRSADVVWDEQDEGEFENYCRNLKSNIELAYEKKLNMPFNDHWSEFMTEYASLFDVSDPELNQLDISGQYEPLLSAAKDSLKQTRLFDKAAYSRDFKKLFFSGMKILTLMPNSPLAESVIKGLQKGFALVCLQEKFIKKLYAEKKYGTALALISGMNPVPQNLKALNEELNKRVAASKIACQKAMDEEKKGSFGKAAESIRFALSQWPSNPEALGFYKEFKSRHSSVCAASESIEGCIKEKKFQNALDICEMAFKECPGYENYFIEQREKIITMRNECLKNLQTANNYLKGGKYEEALSIYVFLGDLRGQTAALEAIAEEAKRKNDWPKAIAALEKLGRWEEAGVLRKNNKIDGEVKLKKKVLTPADIFKKCKSGVVVIKSTINGKPVFGSGFAVTKDGYIISNKHCVTLEGRRASQVKAAHPDWRGEIEARIVKISDNRDLALLKVSKKFNDPIALGDGDIPVGSRVFALGNPGSRAGAATSDILQLTFTDGIVSAQDRDFFGNPCIQTTATINHGNSGGPLIDENCRAVGVNTFTLNDLGVANTFFAIKIDEAKKCFRNELKLPLAKDKETKSSEKKSFLEKTFGF